MYRIYALRSTHIKNIVFYSIALLFFIFFVFTWFSRFYPADETFRTNPKLGDIYFIDYYEITQDSEHLRYPYRMARLVKIDPSRKLLILNLGAWSYNNKYSLVKEYLSKRDSHFSYFSYSDIYIPLSMLKNQRLVWQIRRRPFTLDIEYYQQKTKIKTTLPRDESKNSL